MADIVLALSAGVFFALCVLYVRVCERIVNGEEAERAGAARGNAEVTRP